MADLIGYSRVLSQQGEAEAAKLLRAYERIVRAGLVTRDVEIERAADTLHLIFHSPVDAVRSTVAIADALARRNKRATSKLFVRFGIDAGQSLRQGAHYVGYAPTAASRLCHHAHPGQVLVTETVQGLIRTAHLALRDLGSWRTPEGTTLHLFEARAPDDTGLPSGSGRFLSALFFSDIVGSTAGAATAGDRRWRDLVERHNAIIREELDRHRGTEIDTAGDGFYASFDSSSRAIQCAMAAGDRVHRIGIDIRAGVHVGECEIVGGKIGGMSVTVGARIKDKAGASEVFVSDAVKDSLIGAGFSFTDRGWHELKGVPGEWRIHSVDHVGT